MKLSSILGAIVVLAAAVALAGCNSSADPSTTVAAPAATTSSPTTTTTTVPDPQVRSLTGTVSVSGSSVTVEATAGGFDVRFVANDISGDTGHLHLYIDQEPPPAGGTVPLGDSAIVHSTGTTLTATLEPGSHVIWLVAADGADRVLAPPTPVRFEIQIDQ